MNKTAGIWLKTTLTGFIGGVSYYLGGWDTLITVMTVFIILDFVTGFAASAVGKSKHGEGVSSCRGLEGIIKKLMCFALVAVAFGVDTVLGKPITRNITVAGIAVNEMVSIIENAASLGVTIPKYLKQILEATRGQLEEGKIDHGE